MGFGDMNMCYNTSCGLENTEENKECTKHNPLIEKPDWDVVCHASAWDDTFGYTKEDFRYIFRLIPSFRVVFTKSYLYFLI